MTREHHALAAAVTRLKQGTDLVPPGVTYVLYWENGKFDSSNSNQYTRGEEARHLKTYI